MPNKHRKLSELQNRRTLLIAQATGLVDQAESEGRDLNASEEIRFIEMTGELGQIKAQLENPDARQGDINAGQPFVGLPDDEIPSRGASRARATIVPSSAYRPRAFADTAQGRQDAYSSGMWLKATLLQDVAAYRWCEARGMTPDVMAAAATSPNTAGGALVPDLLSSRIIDLRDEAGVFRKSADVVPMGSATEIFARRTGGLTAHFAGEGGEGVESDLGWDNVTLNAKKLVVLSRMSSEVSEDAIISLADRYAIETASAFAEKEDQCGFNGDGSVTYGGIVGVLVKALDASHSLAKVAAAPGHDEFAELDADDLLKLMAAIAPYAKRGSAWYCSPTAKAMVIDAIKIAGGGNTSSMLAALQDDSFLGYPVLITTVMNDDPSATYDGQPMLGFGNLRQAAMLGTRREIRVALSPDRYFELDQIGVRGTERFDINVHSLGSTKEKPPFAILVGTSDGG